MATKILVIDNYDSFVFNLVQYLQQLGAECTVVRNDAVAAARLPSMTASLSLQVLELQKKLASQ